MTVANILIILCSVSLLFFLFFIVVFVGLEYAFFAANRLTIELKRKQQTRSGILLGHFFEYPEKFWGGTITAFYLSLIGFCLSLHFLSGHLIKMFPEVLRDFEYTQIIVDWVLASVFILLTISFIAKRGFESNPEGKLGSWAGFLNFVIKFTNPIANFFIRISEVILKYLFNVKTSRKQSIFERVDPNLFLRNSIHGHNDDDSLNKELFEKVLQLTQIKVRKCMIPRNEILAMDVSSAPQEVRDAFVRSKLSKIIIYEKDIDTVIGYVHHLELGRNPGSIKEILHTIPTVPQTMNAIDLIHLFTKERKSIAWVIDEFGGTAGFVTMEDVLEEIFGDIKDEYDIEEYTESQIAENEYIFSGRLKLDYLKQKYDIDLEDKDTETLSGYIIKNYATIPKQNSKIIINKCEFEILLATQTKIETVKLKVLHS
ncbi:HlyC/CorC family transporter [Taibaiella sp. KBW10]|uniref:hemolysin family protein n=1 Tax=Taibaiella sp. KBW10 TaxID=2153357 RepID=UPI000F5A835F|nr:hemolysin family protein [Taibaiella sp. KBW10]RQO31317.1 HlyC/CorC family transporter [Taibaiella sp. KBW10]